MSNWAIAHRLGTPAPNSQDGSCRRYGSQGRGRAAQTATPDSENGRYSFNPVSDGVLRLDTRTGQVSHCSRSDAGWACKVIPDERSALESEIARLQDESATLKKELLARGLPAPGAPTPSTTKPDEPEFKLPSDADVDKMISFLEKFWRRL
jgi:hypothetical protein